MSAEHRYSTVVGLGDGERKMGEAAAVTAKSNFKNTLWSFNRFLGMKQSSPKLKEELRFASAKCVGAENRGIAFELQLHGKPGVFTPEQLGAMFIGKLRTTYEAAGISCKDVVISVPPYFSAVERQALLDAVNIAGLNCARIMSETSAIGVCYGLFRQNEFGDKPRHVMFLDLGYSKLTVSVMEFRNTHFTILAQGWETNLGARNMDRAIIDMLSDDFMKKYKKDPRQNSKAMVRMAEAVEKARQILSANTEVVISVESVMDDRDIVCNMTRKEFDAVIAPCTERVGALCRRVLAESRVRPEEIYSVEMVGEASRIPAVAQCVHDCVGANVTRTMNSMDCVARGCATQCAMLNPLFKIKEYGTVERNPFPIDVVYNVTQKKDGKDQTQRHAKRLFDKGCTFPEVKSLDFENRTDPLELQLTYSSPSEIPLGGPFLLGNFRTSAGESKGHRFVLSVKVALDHNMISTVSAAEMVEYDNKDKKRVTQLDVAYEVHGMSAKRIEAFSGLERDMSRDDAAIIGTKEERNALESYIYETKAKVGAELKSYADPRTLQTIAEHLERTEKWLFEIEESRAKDVYGSKLQELRALAEPVILRYKAFEGLMDRAKMLISVHQRAVDLIREMVRRYDVTRDRTSRREAGRRRNGRH